MCSDAKHTIHHAQHHFGWDNSLAPIDTVAPGTTIEFECKDASAGQITAQSSVADVDTLDFSLVNPVTGPIYIDDAKPGDVIKVTIDQFTASGFGWTANIPGFGLLADQFPQSALHVWQYDQTLATPAAFGPGGKVPLRPFAGTVGLALAEPGLHSIVPPRRVGGNMDIKDLGTGSILYLPVEVAGGLFSIGDTHAAQGDGEVCGTALESPMSATVTLDLLKDEPLNMPRFTTPGPVSQHIDKAGYEVTTGIGEDLMQGAASALSQMVDMLAGRYNMAPVDAYMLCSVCGDLRISEIVDQPNWIVSFYFPRIVLE